MKMQRILMAIVAVLLLSSCEKVVMEEPETPEEHVNLILRITGFEQIPFDTRASTDITELCSRISFVLFKDGDKVKELKQKSGDSDFGTAALSLPEGNYRLVVIAHNGEGNATVSSADKITFQNNVVSDTFYYYGEVKVDNNLNSLELVLSRPVSMFRFEITDNMPDNVRKMQFKTANAAYREARWADAKKAYHEVLTQYPETENSVRAVAQLAECYFELWREARDPKEKAALRCECDAVEGYFTERFSGVNPKWTRAAGDDVLRMAGREMTTGSRAQSQHLYDMYFRLYPTHYNAAQMAMSLGTAAYKAEDYAQAIHYYDTVLTQYSNSTHRANALKMNSVCYGKLGEEAKQIEYLKQYLGEAKMAADLVQSRLSLATIERNRGLALYAEASTNTVEETAAELRKAAAVMVLSASPRHSPRPKTRRRWRPAATSRCILRATPGSACSSRSGRWT